MPTASGGACAAADAPARGSRLRILLSEGSSTSARQAITALGLGGHHVEICDPDPHCIGRFSRFVRRFHRCPGLAADPAGYLSFVLDLVARRRFDVLLPIHEQGLALAAVRQRLAAHVAVALPSFEAYERACSKAGFSRLLSELALPQPATRFVRTSQEVVGHARYPVVLKTSIGTASRGVWIVKDRSELADALAELERHRGFDDTVLLQEFISGTVEHAQAIFCDGGLVAVHAYRQVVRGAGGGDAVKESVHRASVRAHLERLGARLGWHGALSVDYVLSESSSEPCYIDCNPRLVEPVNALTAGLDLTNLLVRVSLGQKPAPESWGRAGVRTHSALQSLLGCAIRSGSRRELAAECWRLGAKRGIYAGSTEDLTPFRRDWPSAVPLAAAAAWLLANPKAAHNIHRSGWGAHLLTPQSVARIRNGIASAEWG